jgi:hypothetical protein
LLKDNRERVDPAARRYTGWSRVEGAIIATFAAGKISPPFKGLRSWHSPRVIHGNRA